MTFKVTTLTVLVVGLVRSSFSPPGMVSILENPAPTLTTPSTWPEALRAVSLPLSAKLTDADVGDVIDVISELLEK